jgi:hypothetical protein
MVFDQILFLNSIVKLGVVHGEFVFAFLTPD